MKDKLNYISSDEYKIETFKRELEREALEISHLYEKSRLTFSNENNVLEILLNKFKNLYDYLNEDSSVNNTLTKLILIEKMLINETYKNMTNVNLENTLFFIINTQLNLLIDTKSVIENVIELTDSAIISENQELKKAGNIIFNELLKHDNEYKPLNQRLNNTLKIIEDYYKAVGIINNYNSNIDKHDDLINEENFKEVVSFCNEIKDIIDDNYNIKL